MQEFLASDFFSWVVLPFLIVIARMVDVTLGTLRIIFVSRGSRLIAPILGFFEVLVWIVAISQIMQNLKNPMTYFAYAFGFAVGNYLGIIAEDKLALGFLVVRIFIIKSDVDLKKKIIDAGFGVTSIQGKGATGEVTILFSVIKRKNLDAFLEIINRDDPKVFYSVETARQAHLGIHPSVGSDVSKDEGLFLRKIVGGFRKRK
ncbi:MAG: DUF2179 domain-containing protein [Clostridiaceae bacterium]|nr:DUF2179 domain-containing protein [Clostridiaceae bacterium]